ncbi:MAG: tyrosine-type recombinase/integrase [Bryobacteraceae bacterium]
MPPDGQARFTKERKDSRSSVIRWNAYRCSEAPATGLRISEALHLLVSDITSDGLLIRKTKLQKTRLVPLHDTAVAGIARYLAYRQRARRGGDHIFVSDEGQPLVSWKVHSVFRTLLKSAGLPLSR